MSKSEPPHKPPNEHVTGLPMTARHALTRMRHPVVLACVAALFFLVRALPAGAALPEWDISYQAITYPGASRTEANAVNRTSFLLRPVEIVGSYTDIQGSHGFLLSGGQYTKLDVPGGSGTTALGINARHEIVGTYRDHSGLTCNYKYSQGTYTAILSACAINNGLHEEVRGINDTGTLVGISTCCLGPRPAGFMQRPNVFNYATWTVPDATETEIRGIDNSAVPRMVGHYTDSDSSTHGALFSANRTTVETYDFPHAYKTEVTGINDTGKIVGWFEGGHGQYDYTLGFMRDEWHRTRLLNYPAASRTRANGINNPDMIDGSFGVVGTYWDRNGYQRGFIAKVSPKRELAPPFP